MCFKQTKYLNIFPQSKWEKNQLYKKFYIFFCFQEKTLSLYRILSFPRVNPALSFTASSCQNSTFRLPFLPGTVWLHNEHF